MVVDLGKPKDWKLKAEETHDPPSRSTGQWDAVGSATCGAWLRGVRLLTSADQQPVELRTASWKLRNLQVNFLLPRPDFANTIPSIDFPIPTTSPLERQPFTASCFAPVLHTCR